MAEDAAELQTLDAESYTETGIATKVGAMLVSEGAFVTRAGGGFKFRHGLGRVPGIVQVQFCPDPSFATAHIVQWPWPRPNSHSTGPVAMRADSLYVYLEFTGLHVFSSWTHHSSWHDESEGYYRVIVG